MGKVVKLLPSSKQREDSGQNHGAILYHGNEPFPKGYQNNEDNQIVAGKPIFYDENRRQRENRQEAGFQKRNEEEQDLVKRGDKAVDKNGMR